MVETISSSTGFGVVSNNGTCNLWVPGGINVKTISITFTDQTWYQKTNSAWTEYWSCPYIVWGSSKSASSSGGSVTLTVSTVPGGDMADMGVRFSAGWNSYSLIDGYSSEKYVSGIPATATAYRNDDGTHTISLTGTPYRYHSRTCSKYHPEEGITYHSGWCYATLNGVGSGGVTNSGTVDMDKSAIDPGTTNAFKIYAGGNAGKVGVTINYTYTTNKVYAFPIDNMHQNPFVATDNQNYPIGAKVLVFAPDDDIGQCVAFRPVDPGLGLPTILIPIEGRPDMVIAIKNTVDN